MRRREEKGQGVGRGKAREHRSNSARESGTARGERNGKGRTQESGMAPGERVRGKVSEHTTNSARESGTARGERNGNREPRRVAGPLRKSQRKGERTRIEISP